MPIPDPILKKVRELCIDNQVTYLRLFGSSLNSFQSSRDVDLVIGPQSLSIQTLAKLNQDFESLFNKPVDLISLKGELIPLLVFEISKKSKPIYEESSKGRGDYSEEISRATSISEDELLAFPQELREKNMISVLGSL